MVQRYNDKRILIYSSILNIIPSGKCWLQTSIYRAKIFFMHTCITGMLNKQNSWNVLRKHL